MKLAYDSDLRDLKLEMRPVLIAADKVWKKHGRELVITCTGGGVHSPGSLHYYGYAIDLRTNYFGTEQVKEVARDLISELPDGFQVIVERTHIHVEYDAILR